MLFLPKAGGEAAAGVKEGASGLKNSLRRASCPTRVFGLVLGAIAAVLAAMLWRVLLVGGSLLFSA